MVFTIALVLHIVSGSAALLSGLVAVIVKKGSVPHKISGKVFFYAMLVTTLGSLVLSAIKPNLFLFCIGIFSFYQNYMGFRAIKNKALIPNSLDKVVWSVALVNGLIMIASLNIVLIVFGAINSTNVFRQWLMNRRVKKQGAPAGEWLQLHIGMMMGAFIATVTAVLVVNVPDQNNKLLASIIWFLPTIVLVPLLVYWSIKFKSRKNLPAGLS